MEGDGKESFYLAPDKKLKAAEVKTVQREPGDRFGSTPLYEPNAAPLSIILNWESNLEKGINSDRLLSADAWGCQRLL
jgi:hypothetical protein